MRQPFKAGEISGHNFAAPDRSIGAKASAIGGDADDWPAQPMFGQHTGNMSMMMLDADFLRDVCVKSVFCRQIFGMQVIGDGLRIDIEKALKVLNAFAKRGQRFQIL